MVGPGFELVYQGLDGMRPSLAARRLSTTGNAATENSTGDACQREESENVRWVLGFGGAVFVVAALSGTEVLSVNSFRCSGSTCCRQRAVVGAGRNPAKPSAAYGADASKMLIIEREEPLEDFLMSQGGVGHSAGTDPPPGPDRWGGRPLQFAAGASRESLGLTDLPNGSASAISAVRDSGRSAAAAAG